MAGRGGDTGRHCHDAQTMSRSCPKCHHIRQPDAAVPDWQCPACGVAYAKAAEAARPAPARAVIYQATPDRSRGWGGWLLVLMLLAAGWLGWQKWGGALVSGGAVLSEQPALSGEAQLRQLAATVRAEDVVMYTTTHCPYCAQARNWLSGYGFAFTECNVETSSACSQEFAATGSDGVPTLKVRGRLMSSGFDSDEFVALLQR